MDKQLSKYHIFLIYAALALVTFVAFEQVRNNEFIWYDDEDYIINNPHVNNGLSIESVGWAFTTSHVGNWHPLTWISHMVDCQLFGLNAGAHHIVNLLIHIANTLLLFLLLKQMTGAVWCSAFVAAVFALHPLHVESVAWAAERKDTLSGLFWMLTIAAYVRYTRQPGFGRYLLVFFALALGLMAKPMLVTLPFVLLLLDYWPLDRIQQLRRSIIEKIPLIILSGASSVVAYIAQQKVGATKLSEILPLNLRAANALISYRDYIVKMVYPTQLAVFYPLHSRTFDVYRAALLLAGISILVILLVRRHRYLTVGWLWYLGTLVPVIGFIQIGSQAMADRYTYLPSIGFFIMVTWGIAEIFGKWRYRKIVLGILGSVVLAALLICTRIQVGYWHDEVPLYKHAFTVTKSNYVMHYFYGWVLQVGEGKEDESKLEEAIKHFDEAIRINPKYIDSYNRKGSTLLSLRRYEEAAASFIEVLRLEPGHMQAINGLGTALEKMGKYDSAIQVYDKALQMRPDSLVIHYKLASIYNSQGKLELVVKHCNEILRLKPDFQEIRINLANVLFRLGRVEEAIETAEEAIKLAETMGDKETAEEVRKQLQQYKTKKASHQQ